uniref:Fibronectin type-III domain-containing protein n=1 Tax=Gallus gallus TaxID=9031 RepID=A0A8V0Y486_CHICK
MFKRRADHQPWETWKCQKPQWDPRIRFVPDKASYNLNETVILTCPVGYWLSHTEVSCMEQNPRQGSTASQSIWHEKNGRGRWQPVERNMICVDVFQVVAGTLEVSSTSIKLNWTCSLPDACQNMQAVCQLAGPSSPPCKAEKVMEQEILHGQKGTFACPPLQPFTVYSVTISVPPSTILFTQHLRTKAMVPQKPEQLQLDARTGTLRWKALPSCRGEIVGYQVLEHSLPYPGSTAAGALCRAALGLSRRWVLLPSAPVLPLAELHSQESARWHLPELPAGDSEPLCHSVHAASPEPRQQIHGDSPGPDSSWRWGCVQPGVPSLHLSFRAVSGLLAMDSSHSGGCALSDGHSLCGDRVVRAVQEKEGRAHQSRGGPLHRAAAI